METNHQRLMSILANADAIDEVMTVSFELLERAFE
jgi:hypothetical protein